MKPRARRLWPALVLALLIAAGGATGALADDWEDYLARHSGGDERACTETLHRGLDALGEMDLKRAAEGFAAAEKEGCGADDGLILAKIAFLYRLRHDDEQALAYYRKALPLLKEQYPAHAARVSAYYNLGYLFEERGQSDQAVLAYRRALEIDPNFTNARTSLRRLRVKRARAALDGGQAEGALAEAEAALALQRQLDEGLIKPNRRAFGEVLLLAIEANMLTGHPERATLLSGQLLTLADGPRAQRLAALWADRKDGLEWAVKAYRAAADLMPKRVGPLLALGALYESKERWADAAGLYREAATRSPEKADLWYALGVALFHSKSIAEAKEAFAKALAIDPGHAEAKDALEQLGGTP